MLLASPHCKQLEEEKEACCCAVGKWLMIEKWFYEWQYLQIAPLKSHHKQKLPQKPQGQTNWKPQNKPFTWHLMEMCVQHLLLSALYVGKDICRPCLSMGRRWGELMRLRSLWTLSTSPWWRVPLTESNPEGKPPWERHREFGRKLISQSWKSEKSPTLCAWESLEMYYTWRKLGRLYLLRRKSFFFFQSGNLFLTWCLKADLVLLWLSLCHYLSYILFITCQKNLWCSV